MIKGKITVQNDGHELYPWTAILETEDKGTFYAYGKTKEEALNKIKPSTRKTIEAVREHAKKKGNDEHK